MGDYSNPYRTYPRKLEAINSYGKEYAVTKAYGGGGGGRSRMFDVTRTTRTTWSSSSSSSSKVSSNSKSIDTSKSIFNGRELKRRKRIAKYKWYAVEGKVKASLKNGFSWLKRRCSQVVHGF